MRLLQLLRSILFTTCFFISTALYAALVLVAVSLAAGLLPAVAPTFYEHFPSNFQVIFGSSITSTVIGFTGRDKVDVPGHAADGGDKRF